MKRFNLWSLGAAMGAMALLGGCAAEEMVHAEEIPTEVLSQLQALGYNTHEAIRFSEEDQVAGTRSGYLLEGDIKITEAELALAEEGINTLEVEGEQYRVNNLVFGLPRTLNVLGYTGGSNALSTNMRTGLQYAVDNYNALGLLITLNLSFGTSVGSADIVVYQTSGGAGGSAGFPSGGNPYKYVQIYSGTGSYSPNVNELIMGHQIGHCIGMAHTDVNDPSACGYNAFNSAIHIPGTPTLSDPGSVWETCYNFSTNGEFNFNDIIALDYLY